MIRAHGRHAECCLNWNTCIYKTGVENFKWNTRKKWTSSLKLVVILSAVSLHWNCARIFKYNDIQYTILTPDKILNSLVHRTLLYVNIYGSYKLPKNSPVFWPTLYIYTPCNTAYHEYVVPRSMPITVPTFSFLDRLSSSSAAKLATSNVTRKLKNSFFVWYILLCCIKSLQQIFIKQSINLSIFHKCPPSAVKWMKVTVSSTCECSMFHNTHNMMSLVINITSLCAYYRNKAMMLLLLNYTV